MSRLIEDGDNGVNELCRLCLKNAVNKGFSDPEFPEMMALLHSEISEAFEEWRRSESTTTGIYYNGNKPEGVPIELADLAIRLFHYCGYLGINLNAAIKEKMKYNETRPYRHGNKKA